jgi:hypothetical protein
MADIVIRFRGQEYRIPDTKAFQAGELVEEIASLQEVLGWLKSPRFHKLARCFGALLRFAGCEVSDREVKAELLTFFGGGENPVIPTITSLIAVLMDGAPEDQVAAGGTSAGGKTGAS